MVVSGFVCVFVFAEGRDQRGRERGKDEQRSFLYQKLFMLLGNEVNRIMGPQKCPSPNPSNL